MKPLFTVSVSKDEIDVDLHEGEQWDDFHSYDLAPRIAQAIRLFCDQYYEDSEPAYHAEQERDVLFEKIVLCLKHEHKGSPD